MTTMGSNGIRLIKNSPQQTYATSCLHISVTQPNLDFGPIYKSNVNKVHFTTIDNLHISKSIPSPVALYKNGLVKFIQPKQQGSFKIYHWSDSSSFVETGAGPFSISGIKTIYTCLVDSKTNSKSETEAIEIQDLRKTGIFIAMSTLKNICIDRSIEPPKLNKSGTCIQITTNHTGQSLIAWTTNPKGDLRFASGAISSDANVLFSFLLDLNSFSRSCSSKINLSCIEPPSMSEDTSNETITIDSGNQNQFLSIRRHPSENINTTLTKLTLHKSCITDQIGLRFYSTLHNATQSDETTVSKTQTQSTTQFILNDGCFYVINDLSCFRQNHQITPLSAKIPFFANGKLKELILPAFFCKTCSKVFIFEANLWDIPPDYEYSRYFKNLSGKIVNGPPQTIKGVKNQQSPLMKSGYSTTHGLQQHNRLYILKKMIDLRVMGKNTRTIICRFLQGLIGSNYNQNSTQIWQSDLNLISRYSGDPSLKYLDSI